MTDDKRSEGVPVPEEASADHERVSLPEYASAYYSPRTPPASTAHDTIETAAVQLDPKIDPSAADTHRVSVDGLQPPPWMTPSPNSDAPTVLVPVVQARRRRRRLVGAGVAAAAALVAWVAFVSPGPAVEPKVAFSPASAPVAPAPHSTASAAAEAPAVPAPAGSVVAVRAVQPAVPAGTERDRTARRPSREAARATAPAPSSWFKPEAPKAWIQ